MFKKKSTFLLIIILILLSIPTLIGIIHGGFFTSDDGNWMVIRFSAFYEALRNGQFPVRFLPRLNNEYGYPVANFLYPLFMYLGTPVHVLGFSFVNTVKIIFGLSLVSSSVFSFFWLRKRFDNLSSLIGSLVYLYFPYHLWDIYKRGSIGEVLALAILPFILWQIERNSLFFVSMGIAFLILAHNTIALLFLPIIIFYYWFSKKDIKKILLTLIFGLGMSCFFWLPALYERKFVVFDKVSVSDFSNYFINFQNLNLIGPVFLLAFLLTFLFVGKIKDKNYWLFFIISILSVFLMFPFSSFIWPAIVSYVQFPFRLISILILTTAFFVSYQLNYSKKTFKLVLTVIYLVLLVFGAKDFISPKEFTDNPDTFYSTNVDTTTVKNEYMPIWVKKTPTSLSSGKVEIVQGKAGISNLINSGNKVSFNVKAQEKSLVSINTVYYPGWVVKIDGMQTKINYENSGLIQFLVVPDSHFVNVQFTEPPLRFISDLISVISFAFVMLGSLLKSRLKRLSFF
jgi:hypothetical protein